MKDERLALFLRDMKAGGVEQCFASLAAAFSDGGYAVDVVLARASGSMLDALPRGVRLVNLDAPGARAGYRSLWRFPRDAMTLARLVIVSGKPSVLGSLPRLAAYLRRERPTALLAAKGYTNLTALWARRLAGVSTRVVVSEHGIFSRETASGAALQKRRLPILAKRRYPDAQGIVCVSRSAAADLARAASLPEHRVAAIYNPIDIAAIQRAARSNVDHPWFAPGQPPLLLAVGRLKPVKDYETLIKAFALIRKTRDLRLMIIGEGAERAHLEALAERLGVAEDVHLPGYDANPARFMARARLLVVSSRHEGFCNVLVEAMACGTPVVATQCPGGPAEILEGGKHGMLVPVGDAQALAAAVQSVLSSRVDRQALRDRAASFSVQRARASYLQLMLG